MTTTPLHHSFKTGSPKSPVKPLTAKQQGIDAMVSGAVAKSPAAQGGEGQNPRAQPLVVKSGDGAAAQEEEEDAEEAEKAEDVARAAAQREAGAFLAYQQRKLVASTAGTPEAEQRNKAAALPSPTR